MSPSISCYQDNDKMFFCDEVELFWKDSLWLLMKTNNIWLCGSRSCRFKGVDSIQTWKSICSNSPCSRAMSMEPCFQAPPFYDCKAKTGTDTGLVVPHVRHCEDMSWGLNWLEQITICNSSICSNELSLYVLLCSHCFRGIFSFQFFKKRKH